MKSLILSTDKAIFDRQGDSFKRMLRYSDLLDGLTVVVLSSNHEAVVEGKLKIVSVFTVSKFFSFFKAIQISSKMEMDVVITQDPLLIGLCGLAIAKLKKTKLLVSVYGTNVFDEYWKKERKINHLLAPVARFVFRQADAIQTDGLATFNQLKKLYGQKVFLKPIIPSNINDFKVEKVAHDGFNILFIGRLVEQKNLPMLLAVIEKISNLELGKKVKWTIIGDGQQRSWFEKEIKNRKLTDCLNMYPLVDRIGIIKFYQQADLLVLTSFFEGFAKVFMEAAAIGVPIVSTRVSGVEDVITEGESGFVVEQGGVDEMVERITNLIADEKKLKLFSERIKSDFWERFSEGRTVEVQRGIFEYLEKL